MSQQEILKAYLKELDAKYENIISFLEQSQQESLQKAINTINTHTAECRRTIEAEYRNEREKTKQKLLKLQIESHVDTHHQNNAIIPKSSMIMNRKRLNRRSKYNDTDEQDDSDCIVISSPPPQKKHKSNPYNQNKKFSIKKKRRFEESDSDYESENETDQSSSEFESIALSKQNKNHNRKQKRKQKRVLDNEYSYEHEHMYSKSKTRHKHNKNNKKQKAHATLVNNNNDLTAYYRKKKEGVKKARERFKKLARNENDKIVVKLPIETVCSEYKAKRIYVTAFGKIPKNKAKAEKYCDGSYIYPIGYKAYRIHLSYKNPRQETKYFMEIKDNGMNGPMYEVYAEDDKTKKWTYSAATTPWEKIIDKISKKAKKLNIGNKKDGLRETHGTSGQRYLGLRDYMIMGIVELLPNAKNCTKYWSAPKHKHGIPPKPFFTGMKTSGIAIQ
eukprot:362_1